MRKLVYIAVIIQIVWALNCALILTGTTDTVTFTSKPTGATVIVDDNKYKTPVTVEVKKSVKDVTFVYEHKDSVKVELRKTTHVLCLGIDILVAGASFGIGFFVPIIDMSTNAVSMLPDNVHYDFETDMKYNSHENKSDLPVK